MIFTKLANALFATGAIALVVSLSGPDVPARRTTPAPTASEFHLLPNTWSPNQPDTESPAAQSPVTASPRRNQPFRLV